MDLIKEARGAVDAAKRKYCGILVVAIAEELNKLTKDKATFPPIQLADGEYCDYINHINKDGSMLIYNNEDCDPSGLAHDDANILNASNWEIEQLCRVLEQLIRFNKENPKPKLVQQILPPDQVDILSRAINLLETALGDQLKKEEKDTGRLNDDINNTLFDIIGLRGMLKSGEISVILPKDIVEYFVHHHNVDFPEYVGDKYQRKEL